MPDTALQDGAIARASTLLASAVRAAQTGGVPIRDLLGSFTGQTPTYQQFRLLCQRLNAFGFWVVEDDTQVLLGRGELPFQVWLSPILSPRAKVGMVDAWGREQ